MAKTTHGLEKFSALKSRDQKVIEMKVNGEKVSVIAAENKITEQTVCNLVGPKGRLIEELQEYEAFIAESTAKRVEYLQNEIKSEAVKAFKDLCKMSSETKDEKIKLNCLESILDRAGISRVSQQKIQQVDGFKKEDREDMYKAVLQDAKLKSIKGGKKD